MIQIGASAATIDTPIEHLIACHRRIEQRLETLINAAGPAGISCAHDLALMGYQVTIFEASETPGGMMVHGIPEFRLNRSVIDKEIDRVVGRVLRGRPAHVTLYSGVREVRLRTEAWP
jgi:ribulose 1,5-bisphosphate synthetase/thiazole synthase